MASSIDAATLTVIISSEITLNGQQINSENSLVIPDVTAFDKRIMSIPTANEVTVVAFATGVAAGTFVRGDMKYFQVTNKDTVNYCRIRVKQYFGYCFDTRLDAGQSFIMGNALESTTETAAIFATYHNADSINAQAFDDDVDIEYIVAST